MIMHSKAAFTRAIFVCRFMTATKLGGRSNEQRSTYYVNLILNDLMYGPCRHCDAIATRNT